MKPSGVLTSPLMQDNGGQPALSRTPRHSVKGRRTPHRTSFSTPPPRTDSGRPLGTEPFPRRRQSTVLVDFLIRVSELRFLQGAQNRFDSSRGHKEAASLGPSADRLRRHGGDPQDLTDVQMAGVVVEPSASGMPLYAGGPRNTSCIKKAPARKHPGPRSRWSRLSGPRQRTSSAF
jgi:hypothetical protein